jgi:RHS repeat-associated protein
MPEEFIDVAIHQQPDGLCAVIDGRYPFRNLGHKAVKMLYPVAPVSTNIGVWMDGVPLPWWWSQETYPTVLPEWPLLPMIQWDISPVPASRPGAPSLETLRWWGSYPGWQADEPHPDVSAPPRPDYFIIRVLADGGSGSTGPGRLLYEQRVSQFEQVYFGALVRRIPDRDEKIYQYEHEFEYRVRLSPPFRPAPGERYWLSVVAGPVACEWAWGWATSAVHWGEPAWQGGSATADVTKWEYDPATALLTRKTYGLGTALEAHVDYTYKADGQMETRKWARLKGGNTPVTTTYDYYGSSDTLKTGELKTVSYDDGQTPSVTYSYNRLGTPSEIQDGLGTRQFTYDDELDLTLEDITTGLYTKKIMPQYDAFGRSTGLKIGPTEDSPYDYEVSYAYDDAETPRLGRFKGVTGPGLPASGAVYGYVTNGDLVSATLFKDGSDSTVASATRVYTADLTGSDLDHRDLLKSVENKKETDPSARISKYTYRYDSVARRTSVVNEGSAFQPNRLNKYGYNFRSELLSSLRYNGTDPDSSGIEVQDEHRAYAYDNIGNRQTYTMAYPSTSTTYQGNALNQHNRTWVPTEVFGYDADGNTTEVGLAAGDFNHDGDVDLMDFSHFQSCFNGPNLPPAQSGCGDADIDADGDVDLMDFSAFQGCYNGANRPPACATPVRPTRYTWDAENRLTKVEPIFPQTDDKRLTFAYDYMGRRVQKVVENYSGEWATANDVRFVWDGWNVVMVISHDENREPQDVVDRKYTWGLDMSGTLQGAAGVAGLLAVEEMSGTNAGSYWYLYDGNGNIGQVTSATDQSVAARYEYDPYGNKLVAEGPYADTNPFRFSTKYRDGEVTGNELYYYDLRYLVPRLGRWASHDPIEEEGGPNLYGFANNGPLNAIDPDGRIIVGIGGLIPFSGKPYLDSIGQRILSQINAWRAQQSPALPPDNYVFVDGSAGIGVGTFAKLAQDYRDRRFPKGERDVCRVEGFAAFGYSDGATTIYRFLQDQADRSLAIPQGIVYLSYVGYIDMVRTNFLSIPKAFPSPTDRVLPLSHDYALHRDAYYQEYDVPNLLCHGWKGFTAIGGSGGFQYRPTNHLQLISAPALHARIISQAVRAYIEHAEAQLKLNQQ